MVFSQTRFRSVWVFFGVLWEVGNVPEGDSGSPLSERNRGEKRTGPALNPLKGSSARLPHWLYHCIPQANTNSFVFIALSPDSRVKKLYPP